MITCVYIYIYILLFAIFVSTYLCIYISTPLIPIRSLQFNSILVKRSNQFNPNRCDSNSEAERRSCTSSNCALPSCESN